MNLDNAINFKKGTPLAEVVSLSIDEWVKENVSVSGYIRKASSRLEILCDGVRTGWYVDKETYAETAGIGYLTTAYAKLSFYPGFEKGLDVFKGVVI